MERRRFNDEQQAEYDRRVIRYLNNRNYIKEAKAMAWRDVENMIFVAELELARNSKEGEGK